MRTLGTAQYLLPERLHLFKLLFPSKRCSQLYFYIHSTIRVCSSSWASRRRRDGNVQRSRSKGRGEPSPAALPPWRKGVQTSVCLMGRLFKEGIERLWGELNILHPALLLSLQVVQYILNRLVKHAHVSTVQGTFISSTLNSFFSSLESSVSFSRRFSAFNCSSIFFSTSLRAINPASLCFTTLTR